jgi:putative SOS response-associated peptidase YedK
MCGRFAVTTDPALLAEKIRAIDEATQQRDGQAPDPAPSSPGANYNVAPTTTISTVVERHTEPGDEATRRVRAMRWGLVPPWTKSTADGTPDTTGPLLINARAEKLTRSPAFRNSAKHKRCLIPMDGWYEWKGAKGAKTPYYMYGEDGELLFMAGLWSTWRPKHPDGEDVPTLLSCTIITTEAAGSLADIHDRMPLSISATDWERWLDPDAPVDEGLLRGHGDLDRIAIREVSTLVNSVRNNGPELVEPAAAAPGQDGLF